MRKGSRMKRWTAGLLVGMALAVPQWAMAHCDTMDGPVVADAQAALAKGDVTPVLKWVGKEQEHEIRSAFQKTQVVRAKGAEAQELADMYFFETLVRVHRAGEGAPYTGLKPAGTDPGPAVRAADAALERGSVDQAVAMVTEQVEKGIRSRFGHAHEAKRHAGHTVEAGRQFVHAYVEFVHYVERMYQDATSNAAHAAGPGEDAAGHAHPEAK